MDAPTERQFDVPVQQRTAKDPVKLLDNARKWASKITGLMIAGVGMLCFVTRAGIGSGPNLSCTVLYLGLMHLLSVRGKLGSAFHLLLDNTVAENKCNTMIYFLAWLVAKDYFHQASFFCMLVGHTYSRIDQSFNTLISQLMSKPIWTVRLLVSYITQYLRPYNCLGTTELVI